MLVLEWDGVGGGEVVGIKKIKSSERRMVDVNLMCVVYDVIFIKVIGFEFVCDIIFFFFDFEVGFVLLFFICGVYFSYFFFLLCCCIVFWYWSFFVYIFCGFWFWF